MTKIRKDAASPLEASPGSGGGGEDASTTTTQNGTKGAEPRGGKAPFGLPNEENPVNEIGQELAEVGVETSEQARPNGVETRAQVRAFEKIRQARLEANSQAQKRREEAAIRNRLESAKVLERPETIEEKFRYVADFLGLKLTSESVAMTPEAEAKIEQVYELVEKVQQNAELREQIRVFSEVFDTTVETTREIIDGTSHWTGEHSTRLTILGHELAEKQWPFSSDYLRGLVQAGYLHDVGKILLPKEILDKDGALTDAEFLTMTGHASRGYELLLALRRHRQWITDGTFHHESYDGKGYGFGHKFDSGKKRNDREPWGLKGAEIPPISRTLQASDVIDALLDFRPYKNGWTMEKVVAMLEQNAGTEFDPLVIAHLTDLYENRQFTSESYFHMEEREREIHEKFAQDFEYSAEHNLQSLADSKQGLLELLATQQGRGRKVFDSQDFLRMLTGSDASKLERISAEFGNANSELEAQTAVGRDLYVDALFLMLKSVDARYEACGGKDSASIGGQDRTENIIRYSIMLAQRELDHRGVTDEKERVEFLRQTAMAAMFCDLGVIKMDAETIGRQGVLGVTGYKEIKTMPEKGQKLLDGFLNGDAREYFEGADIGAREANLWVDGETGYGLPTQSDGKPSAIGRIVAIAYKYTALRSKTAYRENGLTHYEAIEAMRENVGREFDEELWKRFEELGAIDMLELFSRRPEIVGKVKELLGGQEPDIVRNDSVILGLFEKTRVALDESEITKKIQSCLETAKQATINGQSRAREKIIEIVESEIIQIQDYESLKSISELYSYDLSAERALLLDALHKRLEDASEEKSEPIKRVMRVHNALAAISMLVGKYAENGMVFEPELVQLLQDKVLPIYRQCAGQLLKTYETKIQEEDYDSAEAIWRMFEQKILQDLDDAEFTAKVEATRRLAEQKQKEVELMQYIKEQISEDVDPWNGEHYIALAHKLIQELTESGVVVSDTTKQTLSTVERDFYRKHYPAVFEQAQTMSEAGSVGVTEELLKKAREWAERAGGSLPEEWVAETMSRAYSQGAEKMKHHLVAGDLGLEDAPKIERWVNNLTNWGQKADTAMTAEAITQLRKQAIATLRHNLPMEVQQLSEKEDVGIVDVKRFWVSFDEYVSKSELATELVDEDVVTAINGLGAVLWQKFVGQELAKKADSGDAHRTDLAVNNFRKFCVEKDRDGNVTVRWEITPEQEQVMMGYQIASRQRALENRLENIQSATKELSVASSATPEERIDVELRDWHRIAGELADMGIVVEEDRLDVSVYGAIEERIIASVHNDRPADVALALRKLASWLDVGMVEKLDVDVEYVKTLIADKLGDWFNELSKRGQLKEFQALSEAVGAWYGDEVLPENYMQLHEQCTEQYLKMAEMQAEIYAIKSWLGPLRELQQEMNQRINHSNGTPMIVINDQINSLAFKICDTYASVHGSMVMMGKLMERALRTQQRGLGQVLISLSSMNTKEAQHDAELLKRLVL